MQFTLMQRYTPPAQGHDNERSSKSKHQENSMATWTHLIDMAMIAPVVDIPASTSPNQNKPLFLECREDSSDHSVTRDHW